MLKNKSTLILIFISILSSIIVIFLFVIFFNIFSEPKPTPKELLELKLSNSNGEEKIKDENGNGLANLLIPPKLSYFQFVLSFSANMKNDTNIMNTEIALSTFEGDNYKARLTHHEPALRKVILDTIADISEDLIRTQKGKQELASKLLIVINDKLLQLGEDPKIEEVHFSSFAIR